PALLQQAQTAGRYMEHLPQGEPVVFLVDYAGGTGSYFAVPLKERTIRMGLPPDREPDLYVVPGTLGNLLGGRATPAPDPPAAKATRSYWSAVRPVLAGTPPIVILQGAGPSQFAEALRAGAALAGPGVAVLRAPAPPAPLLAVPLPRAVPGTLPSALWALAILGL